jgi:serine/threonine protein kinase
MPSLRGGAPCCRYDAWWRITRGPSRSSSVMRKTPWRAEDSITASHRNYLIWPLSASINSDLPLTIATRLGHYEILSALGVGGMGEVNKARDRRLERDVAIKVLSRRLTLTQRRHSIRGGGPAPHLHVTDPPSKQGCEHLRVASIQPRPQNLKSHARH